MELNELRKKIDEIDSKILKLLNERFKTAFEIGEYKKKNNLEIHNFVREQEILNALCKNIQYPTKENYIRSIYSEILSASRELQEKTKIAYFGLEQSYTHLASIKFFGTFCEYLSNSTIQDVFLEVEKENVEFGVVPVENSTEGIVSHTFDLMMEKDMQIYSEVLLEIHHNLLSKENDLKNIERVYSHPQALAQTRNWLEKNLPNREIIAEDSTTKAAQLASLEKKSAAIASSSAGLKYGLNILAANIEDKANNVTKFLVISKKEPQKSEKNKTSIMFSIKDSVGALFEMLTPFRDAGLNLTKIESRPTKKRAWEYVFFVDFLGHKNDENVVKALQELEKKCLFLKILGSYPVE